MKYVETISLQNSNVQPVMIATVPNVTLAIALVHLDLTPNTIITIEINQHFFHYAKAL